MAGMSAEQRAADGLRHVANEDAGRAVKPLGIGGKLAEIAKEHRMPPKPVSRQAHDLPAGAVRG